MKRFARTEMLLGSQAMARLRNSRVAVVGLGAVGSYAVEGLARSGIGHIRIVDFDEVRASNINRQLYALDSTLGRPKVEIARERILDINPDCEVDARQEFVDAATAPSILEPPVDVLIDAIDSVSPKVELLSVVAGTDIFALSSMGAASRTDPGLVRVGDISETEACPLARRIRKLLKRRGIGTGIRCVYSIEAPGTAGDAARRPENVEEEEALERGRKRAPIGSFSCLTGIFGLVAAREAIFHLTHL
ncbi:MAG: tRNA threonylcarbamoyladenosine dehydratase [Lentisphaerales bacterium]|jgi:tRNA A37 threonylcarbamoyladenosine dehydratase|nr:MAG: tRNA threonylcarbamoyladenosine dehydratase [Lentisphaerales bacterium]